MRLDFKPQVLKLVSILYVNQISNAGFVCCRIDSYMNNHVLNTCSMVYSIYNHMGLCYAWTFANKNYDTSLWTALLMNCHAA